ncbi:MAG: endolytic transglycosylase MltG [Desulfomonile tiedjei]|nr:endolytic transglycosylase MltG [Desulfomonile tiedjei]
MRSSILSVVKFIFISVILVAVGTAGYLVYRHVPALLEKAAPVAVSESVPAGQEVIVTVPKGATLSQIGTVLQEKGVISNRLVFRLVALIRGEQRNIKAGDYALKTGSDAGEVLDQLISGKTIIFSLTVPEGYNLYQIAEVFEQSGIVSRQEFLTWAKDPAFLKELKVDGTSLEGYLFPDTYFLRPSEKTDGRLVVRKMVQRFYEVYDKHVRPTAEEQGWNTGEVVTLASLIEKEARESEHALVSAVFHNRLRQKIRLQSDPTVIYGIKAMGAKITREDLNRKHPYNTYQNYGLPPGPIACPGKASLIAAVKPEAVDYLYFVAKNDGSHQFSSSLQEHNRWVNLYQRNPKTGTQ